MTSDYKPLLSDTLAYLQAMAASATRPEQALTQFHQLQQRHPEARMDLLWEEEGFDRSVHYDALIHLGGAGTISLSYCPDRALPWPMRGVLRADERTLLRVNSIKIAIDQAVACLDFIWDDAALVNRLVNAGLLEEIFSQEPVELDDAELQAAMDAFRRAKGLYTADDTYRWMQRNSLSHAQLEALVRSKAMIARLRERVIAGRVEPHFAAHRAAFDRARIARLTLPDPAEARAVAEAIASGAQSFYAAAQAAFEQQAPGAPAAELFATVERRALAPDLAAAVFGAEPGAVVGPVATEAGHALVLVLSLHPARLDEATRRQIGQELFDAWLAERRERATIEWYWGNAARTAPAA